MDPLNNLLEKSGVGGYLNNLKDLSENDVKGLIESDKKYGDSWRKRGGVGAFMMLARKWDRIEKRMEEEGYDIFLGLAKDQREEGLVDDIRDLRRYLLLVESEMLERGFPRVASKLPKTRPVFDANSIREEYFHNVIGIEEEELNSGGC